MTLTVKNLGYVKGSRLIRNHRRVGVFVSTEIVNRAALAARPPTDLVH